MTTYAWQGSANDTLDGDDEATRKQLEVALAEVKPPDRRRRAGVTGVHDVREGRSPCMVLMGQ
jgi:hypothetical protein